MRKRDTIAASAALIVLCSALIILCGLIAPFFGQMFCDVLGLDSNRSNHQTQQYQEPWTEY